MLWCWTQVFDYLHTVKLKVTGLNRTVVKQLFSLASGYTLTLTSGHNAFCNFHNNTLSSNMLLLDCTETNEIKQGCKMVKVRILLCGKSKRFSCTLWNCITTNNIDTDTFFQNVQSFCKISNEYAKITRLLLWDVDCTSHVLRTFTTF